jgi:hypothetical protein
VKNRFFDAAAAEVLQLLAEGNLNGAYFPFLVKNSRVLFAKLLGSGYQSLFVSTTFFPSTSTLSSSSPPLTTVTSTSFSFLNCSPHGRQYTFWSVTQGNSGFLRFACFASSHG